MSGNCCSLCYVVLPIVAYIAWKLVKSRKSYPQIHDKNYKKDVVYLYQFPRSKTVPNTSPYCLKIETFLRASGIPHEIRYTAFGRSEQGLLPFVELNGEHIADSQFICERLRKHFSIPKLDSIEKEASSRAIARMVDGHTFYVLHYHKFKTFAQTKEFFKHFSSDIGVPSVLIPFVHPLLAFHFWCWAHKRIRSSLGSFSDAHFHELMRLDLNVLRDTLGDNKFLFGDELSTADSSAFGVIAAAYYLPFETEVKRVLDEEYPTLVAYCERIKELVFGDDFESHEQ